MENSVMSAAHLQVRLIIYLIHALHKTGFTNLRFMLELDGDNFSVYLGPRRFFAQSDGLYFSDEFRHRGVHLKIDSTIPSPDELIEMLEKNMSNGFASGSAEGLRGVRDPDYASWLDSIANFLGDFDMALPCRSEAEHLDPNSTALRMEFCRHIQDRRLAPTIHFPPPPGGALRGVSRPVVFDSDVTTAQPLPESMKGHRWDVRTGYNKEQLFGKTYEQYT